jgi:hypothetical protein
MVFMKIPSLFAVVVVCGFVAASTSSAPADEVVLQDNKILAAFDSNSGALTRLENPITHWAAEQKPNLGVSFRMNVLSSDNRNILVPGHSQHAVEVKKISDNQVSFQWKNLVTEQGETLPMSLTAIVTLANGSLTFAATVENDSTQMVESIDYPYLNNLKPAADGSPLLAKHMWYGNLQSAPVAPSTTVESKQSLFCLIQSPAEGLYVEMRDPTQPYELKFAFDHRGQTRSEGNPPRVEFHTTHVAYVHPHSTVTLAPVFMQFYNGDWHGGVDLYKDWRATWFKQPHLASWIQDVNSWQQLQIDSPEQDFRVPYTNLLAYGKECAANGVQAIQLVGWNHGGQDGGDPAQDIEPGLGTWQELHDAIAQIQALGVKMILFAKLNWADKTTAWDTNELYKYACVDPDGKRYEQGGYSYYTPTQLAGLNNHRRDVMDFQDPAYRDVATKEFEKLLALGSEGWLWDEVCHHASVMYNYAPGHGYTPPGYIYGGDLPLGAQLRAAADKVSPDFLFSGEGPEDWLMQYFPCSYFRINADSVPVCRYIDSQAPLMVAVTGFDDREILNLILMDRYIISYEPYNFKGFLTDYPLTLDYGKKIDALRRKYKEYLWDADFRDTLGADVTADGSVRHTVFVTKAGKRAVVVVNMEFSKPITAKVDLPQPGSLVVATPEKPDAVRTDGTLTIPARSAAVVMEQ